MDIDETEKARDLLTEHGFLMKCDLHPGQYISVYRYVDPLADLQLANLAAETSQYFEMSKRDLKLFFIEIVEFTGCTECRK